jgi:hypothetical protein
MNFDEAMQVWAKEQFKQNKYPYFEDDTFDVESTVIYCGGCETCGYEVAGYEITNLRTKRTLNVEIYFSSLMKQLQTISEA